MFPERFFSKLCQLVSRTLEGVVPPTFRLQFGEKPFRKFVLFSLRELNSLFKRFFKKLRHDVSLPASAPCSNRANGFNGFTISRNLREH